MRELIQGILDGPGLIILSATFVILFVSESYFQLRERVQGRWKRIVINAVVSIPAFAVLRLVFIPVVVWIAIQNQTLQIGLNYLYELPSSVEFAIAFLLLDYTNYLWHVLLHRMPLLWRIHLVHHTDLDLDVSTAMRFHFLELFGSVIFRGLAVLLLGATPALVLIYEIVFEAATQFHHSNLRLPFRLEKFLNKIFVTPRMHGIHHSVVKDETDSNYSVIFSFWDRLHRTVKLNIKQENLVIGVPSYHDPNELTIGYLLTLPFSKIRPWGNTAPPRKKEGEDVLKK